MIHGTPAGNAAGHAARARAGTGPAYDKKHPGQQTQKLEEHDGLTASLKRPQQKHVTIAAAFAAPVAETVPGVEREQSGAPAARIAEQSGPAAA